MHCEHEQSLTHIVEGVIDSGRDDLPIGLCSFNSDLSICRKYEQDNCYKISEVCFQYSLGIVLLNSNNLDAAIKAFDSLIANRPNAHAAYFLRAETAKVKSEDLVNAGRAIEDFSEVLDRDKKFIQAYERRAEYYRGKVRNAIEVFKEVLSKDPDHLDACTSLAQAFREVGNIRMARSKFNQSLSLNSDHVMTRQLRGDLLYHSGEASLAVNDFDKCLEEEPGSVRCGYMKAISHFSPHRNAWWRKWVMVQHTTVLKASPEFLRAHYLRGGTQYRMFELFFFTIYTSGLFS
ncbi:TTC13-like protein [Mya arenaria]|uniref:TTC13-like protein n=1 Tax=Mya arenaria TaxID=6604 RepID=A0ABY7GB34_MYAAR|nr:TTC13-like protein [Mya arenaria]